MFGTLSGVHLSRLRLRSIAKSLIGEGPPCELSVVGDVHPQALAVFGYISIVLVTLSITGCHGVNPAELDFTRAQPAEADVVGRWMPMPKGLEETTPSTASTQELNLRHDGSFSAVDLPTAPDVGGASPKGLLSGSGAWHLDKDADGFTIWIINLDFANHHRETVHLRHQKPPYLIHIFTGDPDSGRAVLLERVR